MADANVVVNMKEALAGRSYPAITRWNRLEGRPRAHDFDRALKAEVRDALWMLAKQWQMGEFQGDDAGSVVLARTCVDIMSIDRFQAGQGIVEELTFDVPLEAKVEQRPLPLRAGSQYLSLDLRLVVGRRWLKLLVREASRLGGLAADYGDAYITQYPVAVPNPVQKADAAICAHLDVWQMASAAAERTMDGIALLEYLALPGNNVYDGIGVNDSDERQKLTNLAGKLQTWFNELILQPPTEGNDAWLPNRLEYQFGVSTPDTTATEDNLQAMVMRAEEYYQGYLDWYALEWRPQETRLSPADITPTALNRESHTFLPTAIVFEGMPNTRWWAFEDRRTNFGEVKPDTTDLGKLLLMEFGLVYANDWFVLPYTLPIGKVAEVKGIAISNVFNERFWIEPLREVAPENWEKWSLYTLSSANAEAQPPAARLVLLPTAPKVQESPVVEEVVLIRDEMANMVWGIERRVPLPSGASRPGGEAAREFFSFLQKPLKEELEKMQARKAELEKVSETERTQDEQDELNLLITKLNDLLPLAPTAPIRYQVMNTVPENWIPFIPVHIEGNVRETQLQRAALPRILEGNGNPPEPVRPRTSLIRHNLPKAYFIHEEEVPRAGTVVSQSYQRTRWVSGKVFTWLGVRKQTGRGEGWSGLAFDQLVPVEKPPAQ